MPHRFTLPSLLISGTSVVLYACRLEYHHDSGGGGNTAPIVTIQMIGHRGASALRPKHTLASYQGAIDDGAGITEPDLVSTEDGVLVTCHKSEISGTINVADVAVLTGRKTTRTIDGQGVTGWLTEDSTPGEPKTPRAREYILNIRPDNAVYNDQLNIPTFDGIIALTRDRSAKLGCNIGIYPETKHPTYLQSIGLLLEDRLIDDLCRDVFTASRTTVHIQLFEMANLKAIRNEIGGSQLNRELIRLMGTSG